MMVKRSWIISLILSLVSTGVFASTPSAVEQADSHAMYYVGTRYLVTRFGWTLAKLPVALTIQLDPATSQIHESLTGGQIDKRGPDGGHKTFIPEGGNGDQFHIQFEGVEGSGTLRTSLRTQITRSTTTRLFLEGLQWQWQFDVGPDHSHIDGTGVFVPGALDIKGTVRDNAGHFVINYRDEYEEVSFDEYLNRKNDILSGKVH